MLEWLTGDGAALRLGGRRVDRAHLRALVVESASRCAEASGPIMVHDADPITVLVTVLGALEAHRAVVVADPDMPAPTIGLLPPGADLVLMTSGSSGTARPVARTLASWTASFAPLSALMGADHDQRRAPAEPNVAITGPLHVSMQLFATLHAIWSGAVVTDDRAVADLVHATPTVLGRLVAAGHRPRRVVVAGAALPRPVLAAARAAGIAVTEYYGAAELSFVAAADHGGDGDGELVDRDVSATLQPFPGVEVDLRDGELWARSPYLSLGYVGTSGPLRRDDRGFATVGDRADAAPGGGLVVRGRGDAAITVSGTTVLAEDVEATIGALAGVQAAAVVAAPDRHHGEVPHAVLELAPAADRASIVAAAGAALTAPQRPRAWYVVGRLPRTASGKVARGALATALAAGTLDAERLDRT